MAYVWQLTYSSWTKPARLKWLDVLALSKDGKYHKVIHRTILSELEWPVGIPKTNALIQLFQNISSKMDFKNKERVEVKSSDKEK